jgi:hypothetical protein
MLPLRIAAALLILHPCVLQCMYLYICSNTLLPLLIVAVALVLCVLQCNPPQPSDEEVYSFT